MLPLRLLSRVVTRVRLMACLSVAAVSCHAEYILDLQKGNDLKVVFDAGLRPWRMRGRESEKCQIGEAEIEILLSTGKRFTMPVESGIFNVHVGNKISQMDFIVPDLGLEKAVVLTKEICAAAGESSADLDQHLAGLGTRPRAEAYWNKRAVVGDAHVNVTFYPLFYFSRVGAKIYVTIKWPGPPPARVGGRRLLPFLDAPIQPPEGYEHLSMDPPPRTGGTVRTPAR